MAKAFDDSFDRYNTSAEMLGVWAAASTNPSRGGVEAPSFGARTGQNAAYVAANNFSFEEGFRCVLRNGAAAEIFVACAFYLPTLPNASGKFFIDLRNGGNARIGRIAFTATGQIEAVNATLSAQIAVTAQPVIQAAEWKWFEMRIRMGAGDGHFEVRDADENVLLNASALDFGSADPVAILHFGAHSGINDGQRYYFDDFSVKDTTGSRMNTFYPRGGVKNILLRPVADDQSSDWSFIARKMFGDGVGQTLGVAAANRGWQVADAAALEIGAGDFFVEGRYRWNSLPGAGEEYTLAGKWGEAGNQRSWRLYHFESGGEHFLAFEISTDGTTGTVTTIHEFPFLPAKWTPYFIGVGRIGGVSRLFINGVRVGPEIADANTYFNGSASLGIARRAENVAAFNGWLDEFRCTIGAGRHATEYTPQTEKFPRDNTDPDWNSVQVLIGFDNGEAIDESQYGRAVTAQGDATALVTNDGEFGYQSIDKPGIDDTFVEARFLPATGTLEFITNPAVGEQVVAGSTTYTYVNTLASANDVLIGVDGEESIDNLRAAINGDAGEGTIYGTGTVPNPDAIASDLPGAIIEVEARTAGTAGNSIVFTTTVTDAVISGAGTLEGGEDIPNPGIYRLQPLPPGITRVDSVTLFTRRSVEGDGSATIQPALIDSALAASVGADTSAPANPAWQIDQFDSNGGTSWTPVDFVGAKGRVNRTT